MRGPRYTSKSTPWPTPIQCAGDGRWPCSAFFQGNDYMNTRGTRQEARKEGWLVNQPGVASIGGGRFRRRDYCPGCTAAMKEEQ